MNQNLPDRNRPMKVNMRPLRGIINFYTKRMRFYHHPRIRRRLISNKVFLGEDRRCDISLVDIYWEDFR